MNLKLHRALVLSGLMAFPAIAQQFTPVPDLSNPPDERKISYALGMNLGLQIKRVGADVDVKAIARGLSDVLAGKPTELQASELRPIFQQEEDIERARMSAKNKRAGAAFPANNAKAPDITTLPDGLQYRVIQSGTGDVPRSADTIILSYKGALINGTEFDHNDHFQTRVAAQVKGWQEALQLMKVGSKWRISVPPHLAYGHEWKRNVGPDSTVIFDLELIAILPESAVTAGPVRGGGLVHSISRNNPPPGDSAASAETDK
jgi:FKBP-type peptidyl-prolyl cis-trans isomerase